MIRLVVTARDESRVVEFPGPEVTIGRGGENDVRIHDEGASRKHCRIEQAPDGSFKITDLASRNGTTVNGQIANEALLKPGDVITIGGTKIVVEALSAEGAPPSPAQAPPPAPEQPPPAIKLVFLAGPNKGQSFLVTRKITSIGRRRRDNDIALFDTGISNRHAEVRLGPDGFVLVDVGSRNGTFLNRERVTRAPVKAGDHIQVGRSLIEVRAADAGTELTEALRKPSERELASEAAEEAAGEPGTAELQMEDLVGPGAAPSRRRTVILLAAIILAIVFFAVAYALRTRRPGQPPPPVEPPGKARKDGQPTTATKAGTAAKATAGPADPAQLAAELAAAAKLATEKRYGEALRLLDEKAQLYPPGHPHAAKLREQADAVRAQARGELDAALRAARKADLTGDLADHDAAQKAFDALRAPLKGTALERDLAEALARLQAAREAAANAPRDAEAAALLAAAKQHSGHREPHIARLHCRELLARFPGSPAAAEAKALLQALDAPLPIPEKK